MAQIGDTARITHRGSKIPDVRDELAYNSYCLYEAVRAAMADQAQEVTRGGIPGLEGPVSVPKIIKSLWPQLDRNWRDSGDAEDHEVREIRSALYSYLRESVNMVCVRPGNPNRMSVWWARNEWNEWDEREREPSEVGQGQDLSLAAVSPEEPPASSTLATSTAPVSEDGEGETVIVCSYCDRPFANMHRLTRHINENHISVPDLITQALETYGKPATTDVISAFISARGFTGGAQALLRNLRELVDDPGSPVTGEFSGSHWEFWLDDSNVEPRPPGDEDDDGDTGDTGRTAYPCREPECTSSFFNISSRLRHEDNYHRTSPWRFWVCPLCRDEPAAFYAQKALMVHGVRMHGITASSGQDYSNFIDESTTEANRKMDALGFSNHTVIDQSGNGTSADAARVIPGQPEPPEAARYESVSGSSVISAVEKLIEENSRLKEENKALRLQLAAADDDDRSQLETENRELRHQLRQLQQLLARVK